MSVFIESTPARGESAKLSVERKRSSGFDPYARVGAAHVPEPKKAPVKRDLRKLGEWIKLKRELDEFTTLDACVRGHGVTDPVLADAVDALGYDQVLARLRSSVAIRRAPASPPIPAPTIAVPLGWHDSWCGARPAGDAASADQFRALAHALGAAGITEVRLSPWRSLVIPIPADTDRDALALRLADAAWSYEPCGVLAAAR